MSQKNDIVALLGSAEENKLVHENTDDDELIAACQADKSYVQVCECPECENIQSYYFGSLTSVEIGEGDSYCYGCEEDVGWEILATVQMAEVGN